jgi:hypothetical protein
MALIVKLNRFLFLFVFITAGTRGLAQTNNSWQSSILKSFFLGEGKQDGLHSRKRIHFYGERRLLDVSHVYDPLCMRRAFDKILTAVYTFSSLSTACIRTPHAWCWEHILFALLFSLSIYGHMLYGRCAAGARGPWFAFVNTYIRERTGRSSENDQREKSEWCWLNLRSRTSRIIRVDWFSIAMTRRLQFEFQRVPPVRSTS